MSKITKDKLILIDDCYRHPNTSPLLFRFEPEPFSTSETRLREASISHAPIGKKSLYIIDGFFLKKEEEELRQFSQTATFSRSSYGSADAVEKGEKPAYSMNGKERWRLFSNPPSAIMEGYKLFSMLAHHLHADITTLPWELCDSFGHASSAVLANKIEEASEESMEFGKHQDCNPEGNISFGIPILYSPAEEFHPRQFINGDLNRPWLISIMLYIAAEGFHPDYRMGTAFYDDHGELALKISCSNMRLVLFEGDIFHSIEASKIPSSVKTWRISYVSVK